MTITKGFLNKEYELRSLKLVGGFLLWILAAYIFYAFFQINREFLRFFTGHLGDSPLLVLTPRENYIHNLFFAAIGSALGYALSLRFILQNSFYGHDRRTKSLIRRTLNTEGFSTWLFLFWFGKLGSILGIWYWTHAFQYEFDLIKEFPLLLLLLPIVLFYSTWPNFSRLIHSKKVRWFLSLTVLFIAMSFGFAFKNFTDYEKINNNILSSSIEHVFDLRIPKSQSFQRITRRALMINFYIVKDTLETEEPAIFFEHIDNRINLQDIRKAVAQEKEKISISEHNYLKANLHIDERIPIGRIKPILDEFRKEDLIRIQFSTARMYSRYPPDYPSFKNSGIQKVLPMYYPVFEEFLNSAEKLDLSNKALKLPKSSMYRNVLIKDYNRIEIKVTKKSVFLNGQVIDSLDLEQIVYGFVKKYAPNYVIIFNIDDEISYKRYIKSLDLLCTQVDRLRNEMSDELYQRPFEDWYREPEQDTIRRKFPKHIVEWSTEEQRLNELMKKTVTILE